LTPLALSRSERGCFRLRQGFLTSGSDAFASRPSQSAYEISDQSIGSNALPVHSGGNRLGVSPNFPCHPLWVPATVQLKELE